MPTLVLVRTYGELFRVREFTPFFAAVSVQIAAGTVSGLALSTMVYLSTGSPLLSALSLFGASFAQVIGATTLLSMADRVPPRRALVVIASVFAVGTLAMTIPGLPVWGILMIILGLGLVNSVAGGVRWGLLGEIVPEGAYILGRSVFSIALGTMQIVGFGVGGLLLQILSPRQALLFSVALYLLAATLLRFGLRARAARAEGRPSVRQTWQVNRMLWSARGRRTVYLAMWVPNGLIVGCEALFVPYAPGSASVLFMAAALGMLTGDIVTGRLIPPQSRERLLTPLRLLLALPILLFALPLPLPLAALAVAASAIGFSSGLMLQERLVKLTPEDVRGQALGLQSAGLLAMQAAGATIAGTVAQFLPAATAMTVMAAASLAITIALTAGLRQPATEVAAEKIGA